MTRQFKKQFENQSQSGRSMVEMLGVLAIIAILSIGGIVGYKLAMNYYQADQIANEINLMRNDLKVKYALGNEELLLGDPYDDTPADENYSGHLSTQYDRYPVDYDCIRKDKAEFYNCREADAYYIKVGNVSKGVCKPLTTLVNGMDGLMYMEINKEVYEKYDLCSSDENNEFYIQFDAEEVNGNYDSNRPEGWCAKDEDCDTSRPICDVENNECVECTEDADCADSGRPLCNIDLGNCESCPPATPKWNGSQCVQCLTYNDCTNSETPKCDESTNTCVACPPRSIFYEGECYPYECRTNKDCNPNGGFENYCHMERGYDKQQEFYDGDSSYDSGKCRSVRGDLDKQLTITTPSGKTITTYGSSQVMTWWSTCRFCAAHAGESDAACEAPTQAEPDFMAGYDMLECADEIVKTKSNNYCHATKVGHTNSVEGNISSVYTQIQQYYGYSYFPWFKESYSLDYVFGLLSNGQVDLSTRHDDDGFARRHPLCVTKAGAH